MQLHVLISVLYIISSNLWLNKLKSNPQQRACNSWCRTALYHTFMFCAKAKLCKNFCHLIFLKPKNMLLKTNSFNFLFVLKLKQEYSLVLVSLIFYLTDRIELFEKTWYKSLQGKAWKAESRNAIQLLITIDPSLRSAWPEVRLFERSQHFVGGLILDSHTMTLAGG